MLRRQAEHPDFCSRASAYKSYNNQTIKGGVKENRGTGRSSLLDALQQAHGQNPDAIMVGTAGSRKAGLREHIEAPRHAVSPACPSPIPVEPEIGFLLQIESPSEVGPSPER